MPKEIDEEHPTVVDVKQAVLGHGWIIQSNQAVELVQRTKLGLAQYAQRMATLPLEQQKSPRWEAQRLVREMVPEYLVTPEGDKPEIPDDLIEEIAATIADESPQR